jgi:hypothetical protein
LYEKTVTAHNEAIKTLEYVENQIIANSQKVKTRVNSEEELSSLQQNTTNLIKVLLELILPTALSKTVVQSIKNTNGKLLSALITLFNNLNSNRYISNFTYNISNFLDNFNNYLSSLSTIELGAVAHTLASVTILLCLLSILSAYYGDRLIIYFDLETKFPKLAKIIRLRRTFQDYYIGFNAI